MPAVLRRALDDAPPSALTLLTQAIAPWSSALHFGARGREFSLGDRKPNVGDRLKRDGEVWIVVDVRQNADGNTVVTLHPDDRAAGATSDGRMPTTRGAA